MNSSTNGVNSHGGAICANNTNSAIINASSFINSSSSGSGGAIYINGSNVNVTNNKFTGSSANINGGVIYNNANIYLKNNTMENSNVVTPNGGKEIYNNKIVYVANLTYLDNTTVRISRGQTIELWATITDDMANTITGKNVTFIVNGINIGSAEAIEGFAKLNYYVNLNMGLYPVFGNYTGRGNKPIVLRNGTLEVVDVKFNVTSFGFIQLYMGPFYMALPAVASVLLGGASVNKAGIVNVIVGTFLFQGILTMTPSVINSVLQTDMSEVIRIIVSNGMILYVATSDR